jgi:NAD(P)H-dependent flavin oxidoreductase YrpB (nitropropane dioxygenase family)
MLKTRITEFFGVERPIVQGGLMWIANAHLTSAQSMGLIRDVPSCRELLDRIMAEAETIIKKTFPQMSGG